jgi:phosphonate transport system permease protein
MNKHTIWLFVEDAPRQAADLLSRAWPPRWSYLDKLWKPLWDTINIATLGTLLGIVLATPVAFLAARNTTPSALGLHHCTHLRAGDDR